MGLVQSVRPQAYVVEKDVSLPATADTTVGISVGAGTLVLAAGFENYDAVGNIDTYTMDVTDGTTVFANDLNFDDTAANSVKVGTTAGLVSAADTIDVVTTITGSPGVITGRVFAVLVEVADQDAGADEVDRDQLA